LRASLDSRRTLMLLRALILLVVAGVAVTGCGGSSGSSSSDADSSATSALAGEAPSVHRVSRAARKRQRRRKIKLAVRRYYSDLSVKDYDSAWNRLSPSMKERIGSYRQWRRGYKYTDSTKVEHISLHKVSYKAATADLTLRSRDTDACGTRVTQTFEGTWSLRFQYPNWVARDISMSKTSGDEPVTDPSNCPDSAPTAPPPSTPAPPTPPDNGSSADTPSRGPSGADGTYNCADFDTQQQAQDWLDANGNVDGLDGDNDGVACQTLP
jgi:hypothetical protein